MKMRVHAAEVERPGVAVGRRDGDVRHRDTRRCARPLAGPARNGTRHADKVAEDERGLAVALAEDERLGEERVVRPRVQPLGEVARHAVALRRRDLHRRCGRFKFRGARGYLSQTQGCQDDQQRTAGC